MKKTFNTLLLFLVLYGAFSCKNDLEPMEMGNHRGLGTKEKPTITTVRMSFGGDYITESEEELVRAGDDDTYTAINVFFKDANDNTDAKPKKYAYGLFSSKGINQDISINLINGYIYSFDATIVVDKDDKIGISQLESGYADPFRISTDKEIGKLPAVFPKDSLNKGFIYSYNKYEFEDLNVDSNRDCFRQLEFGSAFVATKESNYESYKIYNHPRVKRYFGTVDSVDPSKSQQVDLKMHYKCFGLKILIEDMPGGSLSFRDSSDGGLVFPEGFILNKKDDYWEGEFSMNDLVNDEDEIKLDFLWDNGDTTGREFDCKFTVHPKKKRILKINLSGTMNVTMGGNIRFSFEEGEDLEEEEQGLSYDADTQTLEII